MINLIKLWWLIGIGKTVYSINSGINTVIYHSTFAPSQDTDNEKDAHGPRYLSKT